MEAQEYMLQAKSRVTNSREDTLWLCSSWFSECFPIPTLGLGCAWGGGCVDYPYHL